MRDELNLMELVERYLGGEMNATDRAAFEERMRTNAELRELVEDQRALHGGIQRLALRPAVNKAFRSYKLGKWAPGIGGAALIAILAVGGWMLAQEGGPLHSSTPSTTEARQQDLLVLPDTAGIKLPALVMQIDPRNDTTLITPNGMVLDIPKGAFVDEAGRAITTPVRITLLEAIDGMDMMKAGLSTMAGDTLLETGGMFYIDAQVDGKRVGIDPKKPLTVMVPSDKADPDMMLYEGALSKDGIVDWRNPKPLPRTLVPVDITTLDFYPPGYLDKLVELGKDAADKGYTDSLYYSFIGSRPQLAISDTARALISLEQLDSTFDYSPYRMIAAVNGIDPAKVKAIWNERFNGTNLASGEFEERMRAIHGTCDNQVLDLYANNLDKNLSTLDSMAVRMGHGAFAKFALRNDGRVQLPEHTAERLRDLYAAWGQQYAEAARRTQEAFWREDVQAAQIHLQRAAKDGVIELERFQKEFTANLRSVYEQLGYQWTPAPPPRTAYVVPVINAGWWNVDKAVLQATTARQSMSYTDDQTGKTATLIYTPITIQVVNQEAFSELRVYFLPTELNSYQRVSESEGVFAERLNALFEYDVLCLGRKDGQQYAASQWKVNGQGNITLTLAPTDDQELKRMIRGSTATVSGDLVEQAQHLEWLEREAKRQAVKQKRENLRNALMPVVFPCWSEADLVEGVPVNQE